MYRTDRNNYYRHQKRATVFTPDYVSQYLFRLVSPLIVKRHGYVLDPCVGEGALLLPWIEDGYNVVGIDIEDQGFPETVVRNYLEVTRGDVPGDPALVLMNAPYNMDHKTKRYINNHYPGRPLLPEIWLQKTIELSGLDVPIVMFTPYGFRLNQTKNSKRWMKFVDKTYPPITTIVSLPKDTFKDVLFHSEVLIFNLPMTNGHYFVEDIAPANTGVINHDGGALI
jgi:hypothetical protein